MSNILEFSTELGLAWPELDAFAQQRVEEFYKLMAAENERQNLTRLISPQEFIEGHVLDVRELLKSGLVEFPAMDLGSGGGVPGLLAAVVRPDSWVLSDSEGKKAEFLGRAAQELGISDRVQVTHLRGEVFLRQNSVKSVVARAVGPVDRIYPWLRACSTWNSLVLLKGPAWEEEWKRFQQSKFRRELRIAAEHHYVVGAENKKRIILQLVRVPRGTFKSNE
ncbi:MAG: class I SAM-dependent methyltransferase [Oligoflexia bacterium]|nr:class I SAM-dependent methyltransferase [Oligoflexia bacterium]